MKTKSIVLLAAALVLSCGVGSAEASRRERRQTQEPTVRAQREPRAPRGELTFRQIRRLYDDGNLVKAEAGLDAMLLRDPYNMEALELKNKILIIRERIYVFKRNLSRNYSAEVERAIREDNFYDALLYLNRIRNLFPEDHDAVTYQRIRADVNERARHFGRHSNMFLRSVDYFANEQFRKASNLVRRLAVNYPRMNRFVGMVSFSEIFETNAERTVMFYNQAHRSFRRGRFDRARNELDFAIALGPNSIPVRVLAEQISMELL
ncbi:MAG: hypothetical protein FWC85_03440 [Elusimicrobia bacterium]|nr:hypothetical protein [Elusimicrobiota bacterium]